MRFLSFKTVMLNILQDMFSFESIEVFWVSASTLCFYWQIPKVYVISWWFYSHFMNSSFSSAIYIGNPLKEVSTLTVYHISFIRVLSGISFGSSANVVHPATTFRNKCKSTNKQFKDLSRITTNAISLAVTKLHKK